MSADIKLRRAGREIPLTPRPANTGEEQAPSPARDAQGRFRPGQSANPKGRPQGSRNRATVALLGQLQEEAPALLKRMISQAKRGDTTALKFLLERILPVCKSAPAGISLPDDPAQAAALLVGLTAAGDISPRDAKDVAELIRLHSDLSTLEDLRQRLEALEAAKGA